MESSFVGGLISGAREKKLADEYVPRMSIVARDRDQKGAHLSGGNQQKGVMRRSPHDAPEQR
jgi:ABC-type sugar transport system ATPase subunit